MPDSSPLCVTDGCWGRTSPAGPSLMQQAAVLTDVHGTWPTSGSTGPQEPLKEREDGGTDLALVTEESSPQEQLWMVINLYGD